MLFLLECPDRYTPGATLSHEERFFFSLSDRVREGVPAHVAMFFLPPLLKFSEAPDATLLPKSDIALVQQLSVVLDSSSHVGVLLALEHEAE